MRRSRSRCCSRQCRPSGRCRRPWSRGGQRCPGRCCRRPRRIRWRSRWLWSRRRQWRIRGCCGRQPGVRRGGRGREGESRKRGRRCRICGDGRGCRQRRPSGRAGGSLSWGWPGSPRRSHGGRGRHRWRQCGGGCVREDDIEADRARVIVAERVTRMLILVVDLHVCHAWELPHGFGQRLDDVVACAVRTAVAGQVDIERPAAKLDPTIADKTVPHRREAVSLFFGVRPLEILIQGCSEWVGGSRDLPEYRVVKRRNALVELLYTREVDLDGDRHRGPCGSWSQRGRNRRGSRRPTRGAGRRRSECASGCCCGSIC